MKTEVYYSYCLPSGWINFGWFVYIVIGKSVFRGTIPYKSGPSAKRATHRIAERIGGKVRVEE